MKYLNTLIILMLANCSFAQIVNDTNTIGLLYSEPEKVTEGVTLFGAIGSKNAYLIDNCGLVVKSWTFDFTITRSCYLLNDASVACITLEYSNNNIAAQTSCIERRSWDDQLIWKYCGIADSIEIDSDFHFLPNGNFLALSKDYYSVNQAIEAGINPDNIGSAYITEKVIELKPKDLQDADLIWQWKLWDHLVQDYDSTKNNYGDVKTQFRKLDINLLKGVVHFNTLNYNDALNQIMLSSYSESEIYIIDHTTSIETAAGSVGGKYGYGGDFLCRWGNPKNYKQEVKQQLSMPHDPNWIPPSHQRFGGYVSVFNNEYGQLMNEEDTKSAIFILNIDPDNDGVYDLSEEGLFLPEEPEFIWTGNFKENNTAYSDAIYSPFMSGVNVLPNGNLHICEGVLGRITEIDRSGEVIWAYRTPVSSSDPSAGTRILEQTQSSKSEIYKTQKYPLDYISQFDVNTCGSVFLENENDVAKKCKEALSPKSNFTYHINGLEVSFISNVEQADSLTWDFGNGNMSSEENPVFKYDEMGIYEVCLISKNCYNIDTLCKSINIELTSVDLNSEKTIFSIENQQIILFGNQHFTQYTLYNIQGAKVISKNLNNQRINIAGLSKGTYFVQLISNRLNDTIIKIVLT